MNSSDSALRATTGKKDGVDFAMLFTLRESRRTSDPVLSRDQSVTDYNFTLDASDDGGSRWWPIPVAGVIIGSEALQLLQR